jgi:predicted Rossmann-fold nucleotide-binding protein
MTVGISPGLSLAEHVTKYDSPFQGFDVLIYTGSGLMGREIENIRSSDIVIIVGGRSGTLGEFAIAYDEGKLIGVLRGTGGMADHIEMMMQVVEKDTGGHIIYGTEPPALLDELMTYYQSVHSRRPSCHG